MILTDIQRGGELVTAHADDWVAHIWVVYWPQIRELCFAGRRRRPRDVWRAIERFRKAKATRKRAAPPREEP